MASYRTTVSLEPTVYDAARGSFKQLGFARMGDLINAALRDYLHRRQVQEKLALLKQAGEDPDYLRNVHRITEEVAGWDGDGLPPEY